MYGKQLNNLKYFCYLIGKWTKSDQSVHLITKSDQFFILKIFLPPDWSLSDNVSDWFLWRMGPSLGPDGPEAVS